MGPLACIKLTLPAALLPLLWDIILRHPLPKIRSNMNKTGIAKPDCLRRVFVVDDEQALSWTLGVILERAGLNIKTFYDAERLLALSATEAPDLVIADVVMPAMSGIELALVLGLRYPLCKVLLFSGQVQTSELLAIAFDQGYTFDVLSKPIRPSLLIDKIHEICPC